MLRHPPVLGGRASNPHPVIATEAVVKAVKSQLSGSKKDQPKRDPPCTSINPPSTLRCCRYSAVSTRPQWCRVKNRVHDCQWAKIALHFLGRDHLSCLCVSRAFARRYNDGALYVYLPHQHYGLSVVIGPDSWRQLFSTIAARQFFDCSAHLFAVVFNET